MSKKESDRKEKRPVIVDRDWPAWSEIECKDCIEGMKKITDNSMDLIITDPPYGIQKTSWDKLSFDWIREVYRILKDGGSFYVFGSVWWYPLIHTKSIEAGFTPKNVICWFYGNSSARLKDNYQMCYEPIGFFVKGKEPHTFNLDAVRVPYESTERLKHKIVKDGKVWKPHPLGKRIGNVLRVSALAGKRFENERTSHPTQKPLDLIKILIRASSKERDIVFDPFMGSGTTAVVCKQLNRKFIGFEINPDYCKIVEERLKKVPRRLDKFV